MKDPEFVRAAARRFGRQCIVVNIDPKHANTQGAEKSAQVHVNGSRVPTGLEAVAWGEVEVEQLGAGEIVLTSMDADGTRDGYDLPMTPRAVAEAVEVPSGRLRRLRPPEHMRAVLTEVRPAAAGRASIFHYRQHSIAETKDYLARPRRPRPARRPAAGRRPSS